MINSLKKFLWKTNGMEFNNTPANSNGYFHLLYRKNIIGILRYESGKWSFEYSEDFKKTDQLKPIIGFLNINKKYTTDELWPFFASRIPALNQPYHLKKIEKTKIDKNDSVALLKLFGMDTITNPFRLVSV